MARSRLIKPEFWDDPKVGKLSRDARLLFVGLWNHSDDYAVVYRHPVLLRARIFSYDDINLDTSSAWLDKLKAIGLINPIMANDEAFLYIKNFLKHQIVNRPSKTWNPETPAAIPDGLIKILKT